MKSKSDNMQQTYDSRLDIQLEIDFISVCQTVLVSRLLYAESFIAGLSRFATVTLAATLAMLFTAWQEADRLHPWRTRGWPV